MDYAQALDWLYRRQRFGVKLGLENMQALLDVLEHPERSFQALHVTGTNGKGSVCAFLASALREAGHRVGLYTSPHLVRFGERIQVDGQPLSDEEVARGVQRLRPVVEGLEARRIVPTFFETVTALAFVHFRERGVPLAVVEVGLGGRLDATNLVQSIASVVTNVGLEHTEQLGTSVQAIAGEKAGIFRSGVPAVTGARREALDVLARSATRAKAPLRVVRRPDPVEETLEGCRFKFPFQGQVRDFRTGMLGEHQAENATLALATLEAVEKHVAVTPDEAQRGIAAARWPGRLELTGRGPVTLLDGAHNAPAMDQLSAFLRRQFPDGKVAACVGILRDKSASKMLELLAASVSRLVLTEVPSGRRLTVEELERALPAGAPPHEAIADPGDAFRALFQKGDEPVRLVTGSLFLVGEARARLLRLERDPEPAHPLLQ